MREVVRLQEHGKTPQGKGQQAIVWRLLGRLGQLEARDARPLIIALGLCAGCAGYFTALREPSWMLVAGSWQEQHSFISRHGRFMAIARARFSLTLLAVSLGVERVEMAERACRFPGHRTAR